MKYVEMPGGSANGTGTPTRWMDTIPLIAPEPWTAEALCAEADPDAWFPEKGQPVAAAKAVCGRCDVRDECLEFALRTREPFGIYGGMTARERRVLRRAA